MVTAFTAEPINMTTKPEWIEYTGSEGQIAEMQNAQYGVLLFDSNEVLDVSDMVSLESYLNNSTTHYLICNPHPKADMICQQAITGQPVWVRILADLGSHGNYYYYLEPTTTPDWNIAGAEYHFTEFNKEV